MTDNHNLKNQLMIYTSAQTKRKLDKYKQNNVKKEITVEWLDIISLIHHRNRTSMLFPKILIQGNYRKYSLTNNLLKMPWLKLISKKDSPNNCKKCSLMILESNKIKVQWNWALMTSTKILKIIRNL